MNNLQEIDAVIGKIQKLNALASEGSGATEAEILQASAHIKRLLAKHNLSMAQCTPKEAATPSFTKQPTEAVANNPAWNREMCCAINALCGVRSIWYKTFGGKCIVAFVGREADAAVARELYWVFRASIAKLWTAAEKEGLKEGRKLYRDHYKLGVAHRMRERAEEAVQMDTPEETAACTALVVQNSEALEKFMKEVVKARPAKSRSSNVDHASFQAGRRDGNKIDMGKDRRLA